MHPTVTIATPAEPIAVGAAVKARQLLAEISDLLRRYFREGSR